MCKQKQCNKTKRIQRKTKRKEKNEKRTNGGKKTQGLYVQNEKQHRRASEFRKVKIDNSWNCAQKLPHKQPASHTSERRAKQRDFVQKKAQHINNRNNHITAFYSYAHNKRIQSLIQHSHTIRIRDQVINIRTQQMPILFLFFFGFISFANISIACAHILRSKRFKRTTAPIAIAFAT